MGSPVRWCVDCQGEKETLKSDQSWDRSAVSVMRPTLCLRSPSYVVTKKGRASACALTGWFADHAEAGALGSVAQIDIRAAR